MDILIFLVFVYLAAKYIKRAKRRKLSTWINMIFGK